MSKIKVPNLINPNAVDELVDVLVGSCGFHFVQLWGRSTLRRWLQANHTVKLIPETLEQYLKRTSATEGYELVKRERIDAMPDWAQRALMHGELHEWKWPDEVMMQTYRHWIDYACTNLPIRPMRQTVEALIEHVAAWDRRLAKQVLIENLNKGVEVVWTHEDFSIVRLLSPEAHDAEGAYMGHCVGTSRYDQREYSEQYSLRGPEGFPLATIQLVDVMIVPRPPAHLQPEDRTKLLAKWRTEIGKTERAKVMAQIQGKGPSKTVAAEHDHLVNLWFDCAYGPHGYRPLNFFDERTYMDYRRLESSPAPRQGLMREILARRPDVLNDVRNAPDLLRFPRGDYGDLTIHRLADEAQLTVRLLPDEPQQP